MTDNPSQPSHKPAVDDPSRQRCMQYLLGELDSAETVAFEQEVSRSSALSDELLDQADLLCHVSASIIDRAPETVLADHRSSRLRWVATVAALAVCLAIIVGSFRVLNRDQSVANVDHGVSTSNATEDATLSEASLIASAWASSRIDGLVIDDALASREDDFAAHEYELVSITEDVVSDNSAFSWMVHAMAAESDSPIEVVPTDG